MKGNGSSDEIPVARVHQKVEITQRETGTFRSGFGDALGSSLGNLVAAVIVLGTMVVVGFGVLVLIANMSTR